MALTPEQEAQILADNAEMKKTLAALAPEVTTLKTQLAEKDTAINDLRTSHQNSSQETAILALKAKCPDVPEATLRALPADVREAQAAVLQESFGKLKAAPNAAKTGADAWRDVGGIGPSVEAEASEALALRETARDKAVQGGDFMGVLRVKSRDTVDFIRKNFATR